MITCNSNGSMDAIAVGVDKRMLALSRIPKEDGALIQAYAEKHIQVLHYTSLHVLHCVSEGRVKTYFLIGLDDKPIRYSLQEDFLSLHQSHPSEDEIKKYSNKLSISLHITKH